MVCKVRSCQNYDKNNKNDCDCILELLDFIKLHYYHLRNEIDEKSSCIFKLETENLTLNKTIDNLRQNTHLNDSTRVKRKKANSNEPPDSTILSTSAIFPKDALNLNDNDIFSEDLNSALNSDSLFEVSCDALNSPVKTVKTLKTPKKEKKTPPRSPLSPINNNKESLTTPTKMTFKAKKNGTPVKLTPTKISDYLPKRILTKETASGKRINIENINRPVDSGVLRAASTSGWLSTEKKHKNNFSKGLSNLNQGLGFIQPVKFERNDSLDNSSESIASSQTLITKPPMRKEHKTKMRQAKLEFDRKKLNSRPGTQLTDDSKADDTFCDEIVGASPGVEGMNSAKDRNAMTQRSLRKLSRKNSDDELFNISMKKSANPWDENEHAKQTSTPNCENENRVRIKDEPQTVKKSHVTNLFNADKADKDVTKLFNADKAEKEFYIPLITEDTINDFSFEQTENKAISNGNSVAILPSQPDDVIIIGDTDNFRFEDINSMDLLDELMRENHETPTMLKTLENKQLLKNQQSSKDVLSRRLVSNIAQAVKLEPQSENLIDEVIIQLDEKEKNNFFKQKFDDVEPTKIEKPLIKSPITLKSLGHSCDCRHCSSYLRFLLAQDLSKEEIKLRLQSNSKHAERPLKLHLTPEGFWDPVMRDFPDGDPRNEVIVDMRFVDKNKENKKQKDSLKIKTENR